MPRLEAQQQKKNQKGKLSGASRNRDPPVKPGDKPSAKLSAKRPTPPNCVVKEKEGDSVSDSDGGDIITTSLKRQADEDDSDIDQFVPVKDRDGNEEKGEAAFEKLLTS